jgi:hypothetical protein
MCLAELVEAQFGKDKWQQIMTAAGLQPTRKFLLIETTSDKDFTNLLAATSQVLKLSQEQTAQAFGEHWCTIFAPRIYDPYFKRAANAREFLLQMESVHVRANKNMPMASPPHFQYEEEGPGKLVMQYSSERNLEELWIGLIKGVGKAFHERLEINRLDKNRVEVVFCGPA